MCSSAIVVPERSSQVVVLDEEMIPEGRPATCATPGALVNFRGLPPLCNGSILSCR